MKSFVLFVATLAVSSAAPATPRDITEKTAAQIGASIAKGEISSEAVTRAFLARVAKIDDSGPQLNAVLALFPDAIQQARTLDRERKRGNIRGPLHGVPVLIKDNIEVAGPLPTTAGSLALKDNVTNRDATVVARLRAAGVVILGKTNLSEWANIRSDNSTSGWSAVGGLTKNPYALDRNACGSSAGSGAAAAARLAPLTIGTETDGSIVCPSSINGIVGLKPTVGLVSRRFIVPISSSQDTAGPMTRTVRDAALLLNVIAGSDAADPATVEADTRKQDYAAGLSNDALKGKRIGVIRLPGTSETEFDHALALMRQCGAELIELKLDLAKGKAIGDLEFKVLLVELKAGMADYLQGLPKGSKVKYRNLADLIAFNRTNAQSELKYFGQDTFETAEKQLGPDDPEYRDARAKALKMAGPELLDAMIDPNRLDAIVAQTNGPAWLSRLGKGDDFEMPSASRLPAVSGYPHLTVPMSSVNGLPIGISFIGKPWDEAKLLAMGYAFEQASQARMEPAFAASVNGVGKP
jgi:amidase